MKLNMNMLDRIVRIIAAIVIGILYFTGIISGTVGIVLAAIAVVFLFTSFLGVCPLYSVFGFSTSDNKYD